MRISRAACVVVSVAIGSILLSGCATGAKGSARRICYDSGHQPGTVEFSNCWQAIARKDNAAVVSSVVDTAAIVGAGYAATHQPVAAYPNRGNRTYSLVQEWFAVSADKMCRYENGSIINVGSRQCARSIVGQ